jgi:hypothetical protein
MSYDNCFCDYDPPAFYHCELRRARKPHKCYECAADIVPGETYEHVRAKWDGVETCNTCQGCVDIRTWTRNNVPCLCWAHGNLIDDCKYAVEEAIRRAPEETAGLWFGLLRRIVERDRKNK